MTRFPLLLAAVFALAPLATAQNLESELQELRERIDEIEELQAETSEKVTGTVVNAFSADSLHFGGHVSSLFTHMEGESTSDTGHVVSVVELFVKAKLDDEWSLFASPGFYTFNGALLDNPITPTDASDPLFTADTSTVDNLFVSRIYGEWKPSDLLSVQGGVVGTPHGVQNREYFVPSRTIAQNPLHTRIFLANHLYPQVVRGLKASGKYTIGDSDWFGYDAYFGSEEDSAGVGVGGLRVGYTFGDLGLTVAANYGQGTRTAATSPTANFGILQSPFAGSFNLSRGYRFGGVDVDWRTSHFSFKGEAYYSGEDGIGVRDQRALSAEATWWVDAEWGISYRYDFYDSGSDVNVLAPGMPLLSRGHSTEHVVGLTYNPHPSVRLRLDLHHNNLPNTSDTVQFANVSWSLSF
ncbi:MAG: hypothetical protein KAI24_03140 [Planctomycetes bacterium]|nr:hypothetical protein [Planctomycetota bacterium]